MIKTTTSHWATIAAVIRVLIAIEAISFLLAALLHTGIQFLPGFVEPRNSAAAIAEGLCGIFLTVSAFAVFAHKAWGWKIAIAAHVFAIAAVLLGITVIALGSNPGGDEANNIFHRAILVVLVIVLIGLLAPGVRAIMGRSNQALQPDRP
jgi:fluoride ion exporter CrcB/FEX